MNLEQRKANLIYEIASLINDDPLSAPVLIEELVEVMFDEQIDHIEDVIVNHFGVEIYGEETNDYSSKVDALVDSMGVTDKEVSTIHRRKDMDLL
tara:strand:+ start:105 stop:389 length:285 start_codon:yes stop_codon:yes gene_type:complete